MRSIEELNVDLNSYADDTCGIIEINKDDLEIPIEIYTHLRWLKTVECW